MVLETPSMFKLRRQASSEYEVKGECDECLMALRDVDLLLSKSIPKKGSLIKISMTNED